VCIECLENYFATKSYVDWIQCTNCLEWLHENCISHFVKNIVVKISVVYSVKKAIVLLLLFSFIVLFV